MINRQPHSTVTIYSVPWITWMYVCQEWKKSIIQLSFLSASCLLTIYREYWDIYTREYIWEWGSVGGSSHSEKPTRQTHSVLSDTDSAIEFTRCQWKGCDGWQAYAKCAMLAESGWTECKAYPFACWYSFVLDSAFDFDWETLQVSFE